jgi:hypothetical protein
MDNLPETIERMTARLEALERRVCILEHPSEASIPEPAQLRAIVQGGQEAEEAPFAQAAGVFSVLGKAMLGIAGAYLLRAVAEMSALPRLAVAAVAVAYAILWLVWAARVKAGEWLTSAIYASTSALILVPLLWELTLRFKLLPAPVTAGLLFAFAITATALAWRRDLAPILWVGNGAAALAALALSVATHNLLPFILALLGMVALCEFATLRQCETSLRPLLALAADLGVWGLVFIYAGPENARVNYQPIGSAEMLAPGCLLLLIFVVSVAYKTIRLARKISIFETTQTLTAFLLAASGLFYFLPISGAFVVGVLCLILSASSYFSAFAFLDGQADRRNYQVFATWSAALFLAGTFLCLLPSWQVALLGPAAIAATIFGVRQERLALEIHGLVFLSAAALAAGLPAFVFSALAGVLPESSVRSVWLGIICAAICYAVGDPVSIGQRKRRLLQLVSATVAVCGAAALLVQGLAWLTALRFVPDVFHIAFIRTLVVCMLALMLAFCGARWHRMELNWIAYVALAFVAAKLVFEDLRHGHMEFIAASIFLFAVTLIAVPRLARFGQRA